TQNVVLRDGESFILGGLTNNTDNNLMQKIPLIGDAPILGALARSSAHTSEKSELLIVITPHVMKDDSGSPASFQPVNNTSNTSSAIPPTVQATLNQPIPHINGGPSNNRIDLNSTEQSFNNQALDLNDTPKKNGAKPAWPVLERFKSKKSDTQDF